MFHHCPWFWKTHILKTESKGIVVTKINHSRSLQGLPNVGPESSGESLDVPHEVDCFQGCTCQNEITISKLPKKISKKVTLNILKAYKFIYIYIYPHEFKERINLWNKLCFCHRLRMCCSGLQTYFQGIALHSQLGVDFEFLSLVKWKGNSMEK